MNQGQSENNFYIRALDFLDRHLSHRRVEKETGIIGEGRRPVKSEWRT